MMRTVINCGARAKRATRLLRVEEWNSPTLAFSPFLPQYYSISLTLRNSSSKK